MRRFIHRVLNVLRPGRADDDLARETAAHLALLEEEHRRRGLPPEEAHLAARRAIGSLALVRDQHRDARSFGWLEDAISDVKHSVRSLRRTPGFTAVAVLTLALGIGANTAIFSVVNTVLLRPLPFEQSDRLVRVVMTMPAQTTGSTELRIPLQVSAAELEQLRTSARTLSTVGIVAQGPTNVRGRDPRMQGAIVSAAFLELMRARPLLGRVLTVADEAADAPPVILLSYATWRRHYGGDAQIIGRSVTVDPVLGPRVSTEYTVIGVMPESFQFPDGETGAWIPARLTPEGNRVPRGSMLARLADGVSFSAAESEILPLVRRIREGFRDNATARYELVGIHQELARPVRPALVVLTVAVGFVLLLACVNVANLVLARTAARQREIVIRGALGASRGRLMRYLLTESVTLGVCGGLVGVVLAFGGIRMLRSLADVLPRIDLGNLLSIPRIDEIGVDVTVLAFSLVIAIVTGILFGLMPALRYARSDNSVAMREGERSTAGGYRLGRRHVTVRDALVVAEIGLAMVLLAGGGLLIRSFIKLSNVDAGYNPSNVVTFQVALPVDAYPPDRAKAFAEELVVRLRSVAGVESAAYANQLPMIDLVNSFPLGSRPLPRPEPGRPPDRRPERTADIRLVSRDYLETMGIALRSGRGFLESDGPGRPRVMLINESLARRDFPNRSPIGEMVFINYFPDPWQIVGVVADVRQFGLAIDPQPQFFVDMRQWTDVDLLVFPAGAYYAVRTAGGGEPIVARVRAIVEQMNPQASLFYVAPMEQLIASTISRPRLYATLLGIFSAVGLGLAVIGIYGVMAYSVAQRTREIGIRVALGARRAQVIALVVKQSAVLTVIGIVIGLAGAAMLSRYLEGLLFGVTPLDPFTFAAAAALFALAALVAAYGPTRRATGVDPLVALRAE